MKKFFVYLLCDPRKPLISNLYNFEPFYVGKGTGRRISDHYRDAKNQSKHSPKLYKIRKLWKLGLKPIEIIVKSNLLNEEALSLEIELIAAIGRKDKSLGPLLNLTDGGDGTINLSFSKKTSEKLSQSLKMAHAAGKFRGAQKLLIGRKRDDNTKNKIKNALLGKKFDQQRKTNIKNSMNSYYSKIENVKKYLVLNDKQEPILTILSNNAISELGFSGLYNSFRKNRPMQRGPFKGWQLIAL